MDRLSLYIADLQADFWRACNFCAFAAVPSAKAHFLMGSYLNASLKNKVYDKLASLSITFIINAPPKSAVSPVMVESKSQAAESLPLKPAFE